MFSVSASLFSQTEFLSQTLQSRFSPGSDSGHHGLSGKQSDELMVGASFNQGLKKGLGVELGKDERVNPAMPSFDVSAVVDNVMKFVENRVRLAEADGASDDELEGMLDAARSGVESGFSQAREQIEALEKMNKPLGERIDQAESGIYERIDQLQEVVLPPKEKERGVIDEIQTSSRDLAPRKSESASYVKAYQRNSESFQFELTTQDGDTVKIFASSDQSYYAEGLRARGEGGSIRYAGAELSSQFGYRLSVEGDLDEQELLAIEDLLNQVNELSEEFYNGDLDTAFSMALEINSDPSEIAKFSLNLSQQSVTAVESGYYRSSPGYQSAGLPRGLAEPLADFASGVRDAMENANRFSQSRELLDSLFDKFDTEQRMSQLLSPLLEALKS
jgi:hypothetical protein